MKPVTEVFNRLSEVWQDYEVRPGQLELAENIASVIDTGATGLFEAGTGTGKTLSYLIPALLADGQVIVSTGTRHLQDQLFLKDIPMLSGLFPDRRVALLKGRANYLCPYRLGRSLKTRQQSDVIEARLIEFRQWSAQSRTGDLNEFLDLEEAGPLVPLVTSTRDNCLGSRCPDFHQCPLYLARQKALEADLIVVNHHLLFADLAQTDDHVRKLLPHAAAVIVDEAHQITETARQFFGQRLSSGQFIDLVRDVRAELFLLGNDDPATLSLVDGFEKMMNQLRREMLAIDASRFTGWLQGEGRELLHDMDDALADLSTGLRVIADRSEGLRLSAERAQRLLDHFALITEAAPEDGDFVQWLDQRESGYTVHLSPVRIANELSPLLADSAASWVFTSATLSVGGSFSHFSNGSGVSDEISAIFPSPFDYETSVKGYLPAELPEPADDRHTKCLVESVLPFIHGNSGRTFFLFTSHRALQEAASILSGIDRPLLVQGQQSKQALMAGFRQLEQSVLLGTQSFWEGVDVRGAGLQLLIIDKLPFPSPGDPLFEGQSRRLKEEGGNPFRDLALPRTAMSLKQGFGRLIREASDAGLFVLGDSRVLKRSYGGYIRSNLPVVHWCDSAVEARAWLGEL